LEKKLNDYNRIGAAFFGGVGLFFAFYGRTLDIGSWSEPGPGFLPFWAGVTLAVMALFLLIGSFRRKDWPVMPPFFPLADSWKRVLMAFISLIAYLFLLPYLGFTLITFFFVAFLVRTIFPQSWSRTLIVAAATTIVARLLFINFLETQLPLGFFHF
jgi:putative tricarboxylic transport membrane protein